MARFLRRCLSLLVVFCLVCEPTLASVSFSGASRTAPHPHFQRLLVEAIPAPTTTGRSLAKGIPVLLGSLALSMGIVSCDGNPVQKDQPTAPKSDISLPTEQSPSPSEARTTPPNIVISGPGRFYVFNLEDMLLHRSSEGRRFKPDEDLFNIELPLKGIKDFSNFIGVKIYWKKGTVSPGGIGVWFTKEHPQDGYFFETEVETGDLASTSEVFLYPFWPARPEFRPQAAGYETHWPKVKDQDIHLRIQYGASNRLRIDRVELVPNNGRMVGSGGFIARPLLWALGAAAGLLILAPYLLGSMDGLSDIPKTLGLFAMIPMSQKWIRWLTNRETEGEIIQRLSTDTWTLVKAPEKDLYGQVYTVRWAAQPANSKSAFQGSQTIDRFIDTFTAHMKRIGFERNPDATLRHPDVRGINERFKKLGIPARVYDAAGITPADEFMERFFQNGIVHAPVATEGQERYHDLFVHLFGLSLLTPELNAAMEAPLTYLREVQKDPVLRQNSELQRFAAMWMNRYDLDALPYYLGQALIEAHHAKKNDLPLNPAESIPHAALRFALGTMASRNLPLNEHLERIQDSLAKQAHTPQEVAQLHALAETPAKVLFTRDQLIEHLAKVAQERVLAETGKVRTSLVLSLLPILGLGIPVLAHSFSSIAPDTQMMWVSFITQLLMVAASILISTLGAGLALSAVLSWLMPTVNTPKTPRPPSRLRSLFTRAA